MATRFHHRGQKLPPPLERSEQEIFVKWWEYQHPGVLLYAVPNGSFLFGDAGQRARQGDRLRKAGLRAGIPDLHCPEWQLWFEMKRQVGGRLSEDQARVIAHLRDIGHHVVIAPGAEAAIAATQEFLRSRNGPLATPA